MPVYTVHEPRLRGDESEADPARFAFVRDGFHFWAFLLTPLWMARYRLWLVLIVYSLIVAALSIGLHLTGVSLGTRLLVSFLIALLVGFEAPTLRRWTLARRGWNNVGLVVADDVESAERRFFDRWTDRSHFARVSASAGTTAPSRTGRMPDVIGLFPEPGART
jgi:Protein of unknown function (DUF2628)